MTGESGSDLDRGATGVGIRAALTNSFGFGGTNASLLFTSIGMYSLKTNENHGIATGKSVENAPVFFAFSTRNRRFLWMGQGLMSNESFGGVDKLELHMLKFSSKSSSSVRTINHIQLDH
jgi:hypothetical protein